MNKPWKYYEIDGHYREGVTEDKVSQPVFNIYSS